MEEVLREILTELKATRALLEADASNHGREAARRVIDRESRTTRVGNTAAYVVPGGDFDPETGTMRAS